MATGISTVMRRPGFIALVIVAALGWIVAIWSVTSSVTQQNELTARIRQLETAGAAMSTHFEDLRRASGTAESLQIQVATARRDLEHLRQQQAQIVEELARIRGEIGPAEQRLQDLRGMQAQAQQELAVSQEKLRQSEHQREQAAKALDEVTTNRDRVAAELREARNQASAFQPELARLTDELTTRRSELADIERQLTASRDAVAGEDAPRQTGSAGVGRSRRAALPDGPGQRAFRCREDQSGWVCSAPE